MNPLLILLAAGGFFYLLFSIATHIDRKAASRGNGRQAALIYALSLAVYCTSWTFYGSVGRASQSGIAFFAVYVGPILLFVLGRPLLARLIAVAKEQHSTSIADFLSARYGRSRALAGLVTIIAVIGIMPYISLQLKAISSTFGLLSNYPLLAPPGGTVPLWSDPALYVTIVLAAFCWLFGTRQIDATEQHRGLVTAVALESVVKLLAFLAAGAFAVWGLQDGLAALFTEAAETPTTAPLLDWRKHLTDLNWWSVVVASAAAMFCLPRQFQVMVVENVNPRHLRTAGWMFPGYLILINLFVLPIALSGTFFMGDSGIAADMFVLALPILGDQPALALLVFIGGISAATAMVLMETIALSTMISNDLIMPIVLRRLLAGDPGRIEQLVKGIRRGAILAVLALAYVYVRVIGESVTLTNFGLMSFAAAVQFAPAMLAGLFWKKASRNGAIVGLAAGFSLWCYTLLLPSFAHSGWLPPAFAESGPLGLTLFAPHALFGIGGMDHFTHGLVWSLLINVSSLIVLSVLPRRWTQATASGRPQSGRSATITQVQALVARFAGLNRSERAFAEFFATDGKTVTADSQADPETLAFAERLLAGAIGAASARELITTAIGQDVQTTSSELDVNRGILVDALDHLGQGVVVIDSALLVCACNRKYQELFELSDDLVAHGTPYETVLRHKARLGEYGPCHIEQKVAERLALIRRRGSHRNERQRPDGTVLEVIGTPLPNGGFVTSYADVTRRQRAEQQLRHANEDLEHRVIERTAELRASRERLKSIADSLFEGVLVVDGDGTLVFANASAKRLLGCSDTTVDWRDCTLDQVLLLRTPDGDFHFQQAPWARVVAEGITSRNDDAIFLTPAGTPLSVAYACSPLWEEKTCCGAIISFRDIEALKRAQREAEQASRLASVGQLAAGIAHEINTPVQYIGDNLRFIGQSFEELRPGSGPADMPDADILLDDVAAAIQESLDGVSQIARIVLSMKEFSHPGTNCKTLTDINRAIDNTLTVSHNAWKQVAELERDFDPELPPLLCYTGEMNQVFLNLIVNAAHAIESSGKRLPGKISITTRSNDNWVEIRVSDTGTGIAESIRNKIFDPFFTTKQVGKGTGQGLAISRDVVVTKHGGTIDVDSEEGRGTTFIVRLPQDQATDTQEDEAGSDADR